MSLGNTLKSIIRPFGVDLVKFPPVSPFIRQLRDFLKRHDINLVIDVGACDGDYCRLLRGPLEYRGQIVSFEPTRRTFDILKSSMSGDPLWRGYNLGISDKEGEATFNTYDSYDFNSLLDLHAKDAETFKIDIRNKKSETITLTTLDAMWGNITDGMSFPRVYLKTDTQGHDKSVIDGARSHLGDVLGIQSEIAAVQIYEGMTPMPEMLGHLSSLGYVPIGFHPLSTADAYGGASAEFDVIFRRA